MHKVCKNAYELKLHRLRKEKPGQQSMEFEMQTLEFCHPKASTQSRSRLAQTAVCKQPLPLVAVLAGGFMEGIVAGLG